MSKPTTIWFGWAFFRSFVAQRGNQALMNIVCVHLAWCFPGPGCFSQAELFNLFQWATRNTWLSRSLVVDPISSGYYGSVKQEKASFCEIAHMTIFPLRWSDWGPLCDPVEGLVVGDAFANLKSSTFRGCGERKMVQKRKWRRERERESVRNGPPIVDLCRTLCCQQWGRGGVEERNNF